MRKQLIIVLLICLQALSVSGQHSSARVREFQIKPSVGFNIPITRLLNKQRATDDLLSYDDNSFYWQVIAGTWFFHKHWGIEFNLQSCNSRHLAKRGDRFQQRLQADYSNQYYVTPDFTQFEKGSLLGGDIERGYLGIVYRLEGKRLFFYPKLAIGSTSFTSNFGGAMLKEKGTNTVIRVNYAAGRLPKEHFTLAAATSVGCKLTKWLYLNVDVLGSWYTTDFTYVKTTTNLNTQQTVSEETPYKRNVLGLSIGAGLTISLK